MGSFRKYVGFDTQAYIFVVINKCAASCDKIILY